jgi:hypothetical protein
MATLLCFVDLIDIECSTLMRDIIVWHWYIDSQQRYICTGNISASDISTSTLRNTHDRHRYTDVDRSTLIYRWRHRHATSIYRHRYISIGIRPSTSIYLTWTTIAINISTSACSSIFRHPLAALMSVSYIHICIRSAFLWVTYRNPNCSASDGQHQCHQFIGDDINATLTYRHWLSNVWCMGVIYRCIKDLTSVGRCTSLSNVPWSHKPGIIKMGIVPSSRISMECNGHWMTKTFYQDMSTSYRSTQIDRDADISIQICRHWYRAFDIGIDISWPYRRWSIDAGLDIDHRHWSIDAGYIGGYRRAIRHGYIDMDYIGSRYHRHEYIDIDISTLLYRHRCSRFPTISAHHDYGDIDLGDIDDIDMATLCLSTLTSLRDIVRRLLYRHLICRYIA